MAVIHVHTPPYTGGYHVAGTTGAGPYDTAVRLYSMGQYRRTFGTRTPATATLYDDLTVYFDEGGAEAWVTRVRPDSTPLNYVEALTAAAATEPTGLRGVAVAVPELTAEVIGAHLIAHAAATGRIALLAPPLETTPTAAAALAATLGLEDDADHAGLLYPWVQVTDVTGATRTVPPTGYAAAARARAHHTVGYHQHPAGERSRARTITRLMTPLTRDDGWELADHLVSAIVTTPTGVQLWGWWSLAADRPNFAHLSTRDTINNIAAVLSIHYSVAAQAKWSSVERTYAALRAVTTSVLSALAGAGGLVRVDAEGVEDGGYRIAMVTNPERTAVEIRVDVRPLQYARLVGFNLYRIPLNVPLHAPRSNA